MDSSKIKSAALRWVVERFSLGNDAATQEEVANNIRNGIRMRGTNLWVLIFAIFIASLGLNTNSTAVIIGAMLISPLMGPILGMGFAISVYDHELLKDSARNFVIMVVVSLITSTIFFTLPLISFDRSELLARTSPTTYDLLIALFGGLAGMVAQTRKERTGTVIPGVAIATALMPPLCTVGYGIATLQLRYILGAAYLFTINSIFIALATALVASMLKYKKVSHLDETKRKRFSSIIVAILLIVTVPSFFVAIDIFRRSAFEANAAHFVDEAFNLDRTVVIESNATYARGRKKKSKIELRLFGEPLSNDILDNIRRQMETVYHLPNVDLTVRQADSDDGKYDITALQTSYSDLLKEKNIQIARLQQELSEIKRIDTLAVSDIASELGVIAPAVKGVSLSRHVVYATDGSPFDTLFICTLQVDPSSSRYTDLDMIENWLGVRTGGETVHVLVEE